MQLFITPFERSGNEIVISNPDVVHQATNVLRYTVGTKLRVQEPSERPVRVEIDLTELQKSHLRGRIIQETPAPVSSQTVHMIIAMTNKVQKLELIIQKLAEIGVQQITFRPAQRSQLREMSASKVERLETIVREAVEQSWGWVIPAIHITKKLPDFASTDTVVVFDAPSGSAENSGQSGGVFVGIVGPEGGFSLQERAMFLEKKYLSVSLGATILRMETAAIIGSWYLKNCL